MGPPPSALPLAGGGGRAAPLVAPPQGAAYLCDGRERRHRPLSAEGRGPIPSGAGRWGLHLPWGGPGACPRLCRWAGRWGCLCLPWGSGTATWLAGQRGLTWWFHVVSYKHTTALTECERPRLPACLCSFRLGVGRGKAACPSCSGTLGAGCPRALCGRLLRPLRQASGWVVHLCGQRKNIPWCRQFQIQIWKKEAQPLLNPSSWLCTGPLTGTACPPSSTPSHCRISTSVG